MSTSQDTPEPFQSRVHPWLMACFGEAIANDRMERNHRFLEESLELVQSCGCSQSEAHQLVDYVFNRPIGEPVQEAGGVMVTLAALCLANHLDMHEAGEIELSRIWTKVEAIRAKQAAKPRHSPLPQHFTPPTEVVTKAQYVFDAQNRSAFLRSQLAEAKRLLEMAAGHPFMEAGWRSKVQELEDELREHLKPTTEDSSVLAPPTVKESLTVTPPLDCSEEELRQFIHSLKDGERMIEMGRSALTGHQGTVYHSEAGGACILWDPLPGQKGQMGTSVTGGARRLSDIQPENDHSSLVEELAVRIGELEMISEQGPSESLYGILSDFLVENKVKPHAVRQADIKEFLSEIVRTSRAIPVVKDSSTTENRV